jgi:rhodanese-related sulfurtransferase
MTSRRYITGLALLLLLFIISTSPAQSQETKAAAGNVQQGSLRGVTPQEAIELVQRNKKNPDFVILDVRTPEEFQSGHIEGAINVDYYNPGFEVELGKLDRAKTYLVYCRTGSRSENTFAHMKELQFRQIYDLEGGITAWRAAGFSVQGQKRQ